MHFTSNYLTKHFLFGIFYTYVLQRYILFTYICICIYLFTYETLCFRPDLASSCAIGRSTYAVIPHKFHLIELLAWFCETRPTQPLCLSIFIFAFNTVSFRCLPVCPFIFQKQL